MSQGVSPVKADAVQLTEDQLRARYAQCEAAKIKELKDRFAKGEVDLQFCLEEMRKLEDQRIEAKIKELKDRVVKKESGVDLQFCLEAIRKQQSPIEKSD